MRTDGERATSRDQSRTLRPDRFLVSALLSLALAGCWDEASLAEEPALHIHILGGESYIIDGQRYELPGDLGAWRQRLTEFAEIPDWLPVDDRPEAPVWPSLRVVIHCAPEMPFVGVQKLRLDIPDGVLWRIELATEDGEAIPIPVPYAGFFDLASPPDPAAEEYWARLAEVLIEVSEAESRTLRHWVGPRLTASPLEVQEILEYRFSHGPVDRIEVHVNNGVLYGEVIALLRTIQKAGIPSVPFVIVGSHE
jgi:hypothetical protein